MTTVRTRSHSNPSTGLAARAWIVAALLAMVHLSSWAAEQTTVPAEPAADAAAGAAPLSRPRACPPTAQHLTAEQVQAGMRNARDRGFLWRISKGGRTSYLFGTIHVARLEWMFPGPTVMQSLNASDTVALEMDLLDPDIHARMSRQMGAAGAQPVPLPLKERLQRQVEAACVAPAAMAALSPEMQLTTLSVLVSRSDGLDPSYGIDLFLAGFGRGAKKPVISLETPELQMRALRAPSAGEMIETLEQGLADLEADRVRPMLNRVAQVWADADHEQLARYESWCDCLRTDADRRTLKRLLDDRNPGLADKLAELHAAGKNVFAAVGSLHMIGPLGLPALMAQRGFVVQPVVFGAAATDKPLPAAEGYDKGG